MLTLIRLNNLVLRAGKREILRHLDWEIRSGESWAVVGPSGSGKSCLSEILSGDLRPSKGEIICSLSRTFDPCQGKGKVLRLAFGGEEEMSARSSPFLQARWYGSEEERSPKVKEALFGRNRKKHLSLLPMLGLSHLLERRVMQLSNGEFRKLSLAKALLEKPALLVLDDPFSGLDRESKNSVKHSLNALIGHGLNLVLFASRVEDIPGKIRHWLYLAQGRGRILSSPREIAALKKDARASKLKKSISRTALERAEGKSLVEMKGVSICYDDFTALHNINWRVREGERWLVTGPNGSGKSTLLALILADHPQSYLSELYLFGSRRGSGESIWEIKQRIGWLSPELEAHYPAATSLLDTVCSGFYDSLGLHRSCSAPKIRQARKMLKSFNLDTARERLFGSLSAGEKRLALLARALMKKPLLLLLDEPTRGLDASARNKVIEVVSKSCGAKGPALIWVTHNPEDTPRGLTHRLRLKQGKIVECGAI